MRFALAGFTLLVATALHAQTPAPSTPAAPGPSPVKWSGYLQAREVYQSDIGLTSTINRARVTASGGVATGLTWRVQGEFRTGNVGTGKASVSLQDAYIRYASGRWALQAGQFKTPFTREFVTSLTEVETADRATVVDSLAPKRDIGLMGELSAGKVATLSLGAFNAEGQNVTANKDSTVLGVGRLVVRPLPFVALGANVARYFGDSLRYGFDANYEGPKLTLRAEWIAQSRDGIAADDDRGWTGLAGFFVTPSVQAVGKYEWFNRPGVAPAQKNRAWTGALNLYPFNNTATRLVVEYISREIGDPGVTKGALLAQAQVRF
jgi:hypothetical protein